MRGRYGVRKAATRAGAQTVLPDAEYRQQLTAFIDTAGADNERNRLIYGRHGYETRVDSAGSHRGVQLLVHARTPNHTLHQQPAKLQQHQHRTGQKQSQIAFDSKFL